MLSSFIDFISSSVDDVGGLLAIAFIGFLIFKGMSDPGRKKKSSSGSKSTAEPRE